MRILLTGATRSHANNFVRPPAFRPLQPNQIIRDILVGLGHQVEWRPAKVGESLDHIDLLFCILSPPNSTASRKSLSMLWVMEQARRRRTPVIYYYEDWNTRATLAGFRAAGTQPRDRFRRKFGPNDFYDDLQDAIRLDLEDDLQATGREFIEPGSELSSRGVTLIPGFTNFGNEHLVSDVLKNKAPVRKFDFTPFTLDDVSKLAPRGGTFFPDRKEAWLFPSLHVHEHWTSKQQTTWPIDHLGQRKMKAPRVPEAEVSLSIGNYMGTLSPEYFHRGSGWHRMRFVYAGWNNTYIWPGLTDAEMYAPDHLIIPPAEYERLSVSDRETASRELGSILWSKMVVDPNVTIDQIVCAINDAKENV